LSIMCLSIGQDLAYVVHRSLNRVGLAFFFSFSDEDVLTTLVVAEM
jgi:hypothetical protein